MRTITHSIRVAADPSTVYSYLTEASKLQEWFPSRAQTDVREGGAYHFAFIRGDGTTDHERTGTFLSLRPDERVAYDWDFGAGPTTVTFELEQEPSATRVTLRHAGFAEEGQGDEAYTMHEAGWGMFMQNLRSRIAGGEDLRKGM